MLLIPRRELWYNNHQVSVELRSRKSERLLWHCSMKGTSLSAKLVDVLFSINPVSRQKMSVFDFNAGANGSRERVYYGGQLVIGSSLKQWVAFSGFLSSGK